MSDLGNEGYYQHYRMYPEQSGLESLEISIHFQLPNSYDNWFLITP